MKKLFVFFLLFKTLTLPAQELFVFSEPASNMPAHSMSLKFTDHFISKDRIYGRLSQRFMPEIMWGISKKWMLHTAITVSNMNTPKYRYESFNVYAKYRFLSHDAIQRHFRMAVFGDVSKTSVPFHNEEITLMGDKSGVALGLIGTQLINRLALSATVSNTQVLDKSRTNKVFYIPERSYQAINYSLSAGYLLLPKKYTSYNQLNINLYAELLAAQNIDVTSHFADLATAVQLIFNSNTKLNMGYRFQLDGTMQRMATNSWQVSFERTFLNALKK